MSQAPRTEGATPPPLPIISPPSPSAGGRGLHRRGLSLSQHQSNMVKSLQQAGCICLILLYPGPGPHLGASDFISILPWPPTAGPQPDPPIPLLKKSGWWSFFREEGRGPRVEEGQLNVKTNSKSPDEQRPLSEPALPSREPKGGRRCLRRPPALARPQQ